MDNDELVLFYQPQVDTRSGKVVGAEALLRWMHPEQGLIPPFKFIPLAEEMGLIGEMGDWVIREACKQVQTFAKKGVSLPKVAVNVSALQFTPSFTRRVKWKLRSGEASCSSPSVKSVKSVVNPTAPHFAIAARMRSRISGDFTSLTPCTSRAKLSYEISVMNCCTYALPSIGV